MRHEQTVTMPVKMYKPTGAKFKGGKLIAKDEKQVTPSGTKHAVIRAEVVYPHLAGKGHK